MSSLPYPEGVDEVVKLLSEVDALAAEAEKLRPMAKRLSEVEGELRAHQKRLPELLRSMDVESPGNYGWERRMGWFLAEMRRQILGLTCKHGYTKPEHGVCGPACEIATAGRE